MVLLLYSSTVLSSNTYMAGAVAGPEPKYGTKVEPGLKINTGFMRNWYKKN